MQLILKLILGMRSNYESLYIKTLSEKTHKHTKYAVLFNKFLVRNSKLK